MTNPGASDAALGAPFAPLAGIRVVDFSTNMAGPYATMILAQLGADVIKVEAPAGDDARAWAPEVDGASIVHRHMNAGKRGIVLDLGTDAGRKAALAIAARSDVLLQSMRPGVAERIGIGEDAVRAVNPDILYYALNAFGAGPVGRDLSGYDPLVQAWKRQAIAQLTALKVSHDQTNGEGSLEDDALLAAIISSAHAGQQIEPFFLFIFPPFSYYSFLFFY